MKVLPEFPQNGLDSSDALINSLVDEAIEALEEDTDYIVFGTDDRFEILARSRHPSTRLFPYNTICLLERDAGGDFAQHCTGTLIAPQVVLTAKHCLEGVNQMRITPGIGRTSPTSANRVRSASPGDMIANSGSFRLAPDLDYGAIILPRAFRRPTQFMMLQPRDESRTATLLTIAGYPGDKPSRTIWGHTGNISVTGVTATHLFYRMDTSPGHSGGPIWLLGNNGIRLLLGVHSGRYPGACPPGPATSSNCGVRITCRVIDRILEWCRQDNVRRPTIDRRQYDRRCVSS